jgi:hypothetical protein
MDFTIHQYGGRRTTREYSRVLNEMRRNSDRTDVYVEMSSGIRYTRRISARAFAMATGLLDCHYDIQYSFGGFCFTSSHGAALREVQDSSQVHMKRRRSSTETIDGIAFKLANNQNP